MSAIWVFRAIRWDFAWLCVCVCVRVRTCACVHAHMYAHMCSVAVCKTSVLEETVFSESSLYHRIDFSPFVKRE